MSEWRGRSAEGDAVSMLGWGLRRYAWAVVLPMLLLGGLVPVVLDATAVERYEATAQVGPSATIKLPNLDPLPRVGETVFNNGAVADAVRSSYAPPLAAREPVIPNRVELIAPQDNVVFTIVGRGSSPTEAKDLANTAAGRFTEELNKYTESVGTFAIQRAAVKPAQPVASLGRSLEVVVGLLAGLILGLGLVFAWLMLRRPILEDAGAERVGRAPVLATVWFDPTGYESRGLPQLCHRLLNDSPEVVFLVSPTAGRDDRSRLASELRDVLAGPRAVTVLSGGHQSFWGPAPVDSGGDQSADMLIVDGPTQTELAVRPPESLTLLVMPVGVAEASLRRAAEDYLDDGAIGIVLVRRTRAGGRLGWSRRRFSRSSTPDATAGV